MTKTSSKRAERRRYYAFVDAIIETPVEARTRYSREVLLLDCVDADAFDQGRLALDHPDSLALIRVVSTRRRLEHGYGLVPVGEGDWLELTVATQRGSPRAWVMPASNGYESEAAANLRSIVKLPDPELEPESPAGRIARRLIEECSLGPDVVWAGDGDIFPAQLHLTGSLGLEIRAVDVGQASCNVFIVDGESIGYFDVGGPLYRNQRSFHGRLCHEIPARGFVLLSHWDFDHFDLGRRHAGLRGLKWFAPNQPVGPNTLKFQKSLGNNLRFLNGAMSSSGFELRPGLSMRPKDRNGTGYSLRLEINDDVVVLTGDTSYEIIDPAILTGATALTVPHHGGPGIANPPPALGKGRAVASYGIPNGYKHPNEPYLALHISRGWTVDRTASHPTNAYKRNWRRIYP